VGLISPIRLPKLSEQGFDFRWAVEQVAYHDGVGAALCWSGSHEVSNYVFERPHAREPMRATFVEGGACCEIDRHDVGLAQALKDDEDNRDESTLHQPHHHCAEQCERGPYGHRCGELLRHHRRASSKSRQYDVPAETKPLGSQLLHHCEALVRVRIADNAADNFEAKLAIKFRRLKVEGV
jgi:hypothetical protein